MGSVDSPDPALTVLWRPGCGFCSALTRRLDRSGVTYRRRNIWDDDDARQALRSAIGCETVPTVLIGDQVLVNPSIHQVFRELAAVAPGEVPDDYVAPEPGRVGRFLTRVLGGDQATGTEG